MAARLRAGLIGCGFYASNHLNAWRDLGEEVELAAVCDLDGEKAQAAAEAFGVPHWHTDAAVMMREERLDFVDIVTTMPSPQAARPAGGAPQAADHRPEALSPDLAGMR